MNTSCKKTIPQIYRVDVLVHVELINPSPDATLPDHIFVAVLGDHKDFFYDFTEAL
jgi:hypothetical protein